MVSKDSRSSALLCTPFRKSCEVVCENEENCDFLQNNGKLRKSGQHLWKRATPGTGFTMRTTSSDQLHCAQLCSLHNGIVVQPCSYAPTSERMPHYAPNFQPPNYANNYAGIIRRCLVTICLEPVAKAAVHQTTAHGRNNGAVEKPKKCEHLRMFEWVSYCSISITPVVFCLIKNHLL